MYNWQKPKKPTFTAGRIVIHSDDGRIYDNIHSRIIKKAIAKHNQFNPRKYCIFCPAVNTGYIDAGIHESVGIPTMSWNDLLEIVENGGEILSHGKYHLYLDGNIISQPLDIGATKIYYTSSEGRPKENMKYYIFEGENRDDFTVISYEHLGTGENNHMTIAPPLSHAYTINAKVHLHEDSMAEQLGGIIADLQEHGIVCKHHINAWYNNSPTSRIYLEQYFQSVISIQSETIEKPSEADIYALKRTRDLRHFSTQEIDAILSEVQAKDGVAFIQMHGNDNPTNFANLDYIITQALIRGIRVVTHSQAIDFIKSKQLS